MKITNYSTYSRTYGLYGKKVHRIYFFNEKGIILQSRAGWLESNYTTLNENVSYFGTKDILNIEIDNPTKKIKKDFSIKKNFYIKAEKIDDCEFWNDLKNEYDLYIYVGNSVKIEKIKELTRKEENTTYIVTVQYKEFLITGITNTPFKMIVSNILETEETNEKRQAQKILEVMKNKKIYSNLDEYTLCQMLKIFNITERE